MEHCSLLGWAADAAAEDMVTMNTVRAAADAAVMAMIRVTKQADVAAAITNL